MLESLFGYSTNHCNKSLLTKKKFFFLGHPQCGLYGLPATAICWWDCM
jgi:hypothetical protein